MAPSTPPPPRSDGLAALTITSTSSVVMSPTTTSMLMASAIVVAELGELVAHRLEHAANAREDLLLVLAHLLKTRHRLLGCKRRLVVRGLQACAILLVGR